MKVLPRLIIATAFILLGKTTPTLSIPITPAKDGTGTQVTPAANNSRQLNIDGGTRSDANLFHSFEKFGLSKDQIANFQSNPNIRNILGRVIGGNASRINGLIQVVGGRSNLFLMNPAGFIFGPNATLNIPGSFTATTSNGIQIGDYWFDAMGSNKFSDLLGEPNGFAFISDQSGSIINAGNLTVPQGERITLAGGTVINTGTLKAPGGNVTIISVPEKQLVKINQEGGLLSLGLPTSVDSVLSSGKEEFSPVSLPQLLTGGSEEIATGVIADSNGVRLIGSETKLPEDPGTTILAGSVDVSNTNGGRAEIFGDKVGLYGALIDASGSQDGGTVLIGGDYKGQGQAPNATRTLIDKNSIIRADSLKDGSGGQVIAWADGITAFDGNISARGGEHSGNGGFVEVSGKRNLLFRGDIDLQSPKGIDGTLLLDPAIIEIFDDEEFFNPDEPIEDTEILISDSESNEVVRIPDNKLNGNIRLEASERITINGELEVESLDLLVEQGVIEIFESITTPELNITNNNGDIIIGTAEQDPSSLNIDIQNIETVEIENPDPNLGLSFLGVEEINTPLGGSANISARNGYIRLFGGITLDGESQLKIDALGFRATDPLVREVNDDTPEGPVTTRVRYNIGAFETNSPIQLSVQFLNPNSDNQNTNTVLISRNSNEVAPFDQNRRPNVEITLREDINLPIGSENILPTGSGISEPIGEFNIENTGNGFSASQLSSYSTDDFSVGLIESSTSPITSSSSSNQTIPNQNIPEDTPQNPSFSSENLFSENRINTNENFDFSTSSENVFKNFTILPIEGTNLVQVSRSELLSLSFKSLFDEKGNRIKITPELLPKLLTGDEKSE